MGQPLTVREQPEPEPLPLPRHEPGERARHWARMLEEGIYSSRAELARAEGVSRAAVTQALRRLDSAAAAEVSIRRKRTRAWRTRRG